MKYFIIPEKYNGLDLRLFYKKLKIHFIDLRFPLLKKYFILINLTLMNSSV